MEQKIKILDFQVEILSMDYLSERIEEYCNGEQMESVLFLSVRIMEAAMDFPEYRRKIGEFQMLLPGEEEILFPERLKLSDKSDITFQEDCLDGLLRFMEKKQKSLYLVGDELEKTEMFLHYCEEQFPKLQLTGVFIIDENMDDEKVLNDINTNCPDVILTAIAPQLQENWITENGDKLNARVCIGADVLVQRTVERYLLCLEKEMHTKIYHYMQNIKNKFLKKIQKRIFYKEYEQYMKQKD